MNKDKPTNASITELDESDLEQAQGGFKVEINGLKPRLSKNDSSIRANSNIRATSKIDKTGGGSGI